MKKEEKTNVMRVLDQKKAVYVSHCFIDLCTDEIATNGVEIANLLGQDPDVVFKTLVTVGKTGQHYVFMVPVAKELDLKKAANAAGEKSIEMIPQKDLLGLTGYVHGGCSPIGMKKQFPTFVHETAKDHDKIVFSGGKVGYQVEMNAKELEKIVRVTYSDIIK